MRTHNQDDVFKCDDIYACSSGLLFQRVHTKNPTTIHVRMLVYCIQQLSSSSRHSIKIRGPSWSWSYGSWIYYYLCFQCLSPLTLWFRIPLGRGLLNTTLCHICCQWLAVGQWFFLSTSVSSTNKTDRHDI